MTLHVICVAYERAIPLMTMINCFLVQTNPNWILHIVYDGPVPDVIKSAISIYNDKRIHFCNSSERLGLWGHPNRKAMLNEINGQENDFVLITNDDNYYVPTFVEQMLAYKSDNLGIVFCNTVHSYMKHALHESHLYEGGIDMGAFIVRLSIAQKVGFNHFHETADGRYAEECRNYCMENKYNAIHIPKPLFIHN